ncbi:hypothetical protein QUH70_01040 [Staphylococcus felis]|uniref:hypothetical protein n=1 Tax=Staphylococcus felis TaxID=46127 RepID=UPI0025A40832|nr:hypothetical protein [Staphylococcus felis]MDM8326731.1 hypothetical protein [Staphylococcus felis]
MKIKVKKEMNLHELIKWAWENGVSDEDFVGDGYGYVFFHKGGTVETDVGVSIHEIFEVEVEEEITEETKIPDMIELLEHTGGVDTYHIYGKSIKQVVDGFDDDYDPTLSKFYMLNPDKTLTLIWKDGEMVE